MKIALTGNPNSGKTTMYNALTGRNEKVGNWAGVTVEAKEHLIKNKFYKGEELIAVDLPGAYSMSPFTSEESITRDYVTENNPDVIINIVDSTNLSRSLFFTTQLLELGIPVVVALNKTEREFPDSDIIGDLTIYADMAGFDKNLGQVANDYLAESVRKMEAISRCITQEDNTDCFDRYCLRHRSYGGILCFR